MRLRSGPLVAAVRSAMGVDELVLVLALTLTTGGLWTWLAWGALVVPGVVLLWLVLPPRAPFVVPDRAEAATRTRGDRQANR